MKHAYDLSSCSVEDMQDVLEFDQNYGCGTQRTLIYFDAREGSFSRGFLQGMRFCHCAWRLTTVTVAAHVIFMALVRTSSRKIRSHLELFTHRPSSTELSQSGP